MISFVKRCSRCGVENTGVVWVCVNCGVSLNG